MDRHNDGPFPDPWLGLLAKPRFDTQTTHILAENHTMRRRIFTLAVVCLAFAAVTQTASARYPFLPTYPFLASPYATDRVPTPPYFSLHPPVYYSYPVPRTYGFSPFAYPGTVRTPDPLATCVRVEPATIINPFVEQAEVGEDDPRVAAKPQTVVNPFVSQELAEAATRADGNLPVMVPLSFNPEP